MKGAKDSADFLLNTANADLDWQSLMDIVRPDGKLCFVGLPPKNISLPATTLLDGRRSICGSPIGGSVLMKEMLRFAARHNIGAQVEVLPMPQVNEAIEKVRKNQARYRMVLKNNPSRV